VNRELRFIIKSPLLTAKKYVNPIAKIKVRRERMSVPMGGVHAGFTFPTIDWDTFSPRH